MFTAGAGRLNLAPMKRCAWLLWVVFAAGLIAGVVRLRFDTEILHLLPSRLGVVRGLGLYQRHFTDPREVIITIEAPTAETAESGARAVARLLGAESNLVSWAAWQPTWVEKPDEAAELIAFLWLNQPPPVVAEMVGRLASANLTNTLEETRERLATSFSPADMAMGGYDPYGFLRLPESLAGASPAIGASHDSFVSADGMLRLVIVRAHPELGDYRACRAWMADLRRAVDTGRDSGVIPAGIRVGYTGRPAFVDEISSGMENDMAGSSSGTLAVIAILFWLTHRRLRPLVWLLLVMLMILAGTLALGGLCLGTINVMSMGFAAILLGLAEDFGIVIYQESRSHPDLDAPALRRRVRPGIFWSAITTAGAFFALNLSVLPGLGQLGTLVALGILLAAVVMLFGYLPPLLRLRRGTDGSRHEGRGERLLLFQPICVMPARFSWGMTVLLACVAVAVLWSRGLCFDRSSGALEPRNSQAQETLARVQGLLGQGRDSLIILLPGRNESEVALRLSRANGILSEAVSRREIAGFTLPTALWPDPENQSANRAALASLVQRSKELHDAALAAGFTAEALRMTEEVLRCWASAPSGESAIWPSNGSSRWFLDKVAARGEGTVIALGAIQPATNAVASGVVGADWARELDAAGAIVTGWGLLGGTIFDQVLRELPFVLLPILAVVVGSLWLAFRSMRDVLLSFATLAFSALMLGALMAALGWKWNLMNVMSLPLLLGMGVDFSIHMQLALRDYRGDRLAVRRSIGRALLLAGATTVAGFASLAFSTNRGMASLGRTCALGITLTLLVAVYLLPVWWRGTCPPNRDGPIRE